jgi:hypothetical protein
LSFSGNRLGVIRGLAFCFFRSTQFRSWQPVTSPRCESRCCRGRLDCRVP